MRCGSDHITKNSWVGPTSLKGASSPSHGGALFLSCQRSQGPPPSGHPMWLATTGQGRRKEGTLGEKLLHLQLVEY